MKYGLVSITVLFHMLVSPAFSQVPRHSFNPDSLSNDFFVQLKKEFGNKKTYAPQLEKPLLIALSYYPELKNTPIRFEYRPKHSSGYTRVAWGGIFEPAATRHYLIVISDSTEPMLMPLLFKNVSFNAQIALLGHELAHVSWFNSIGALDFLQHVIKNVSAKYIDRYEYNTDAICIAHGLGYQLLAWSTYVRKTMNTVNWLGADYAHRPKKRERYMNPATIMKRIAAEPIYHE